MVCRAAFTMSSHWRSLLQAFDEPAQVCLSRSGVFVGIMGRISWRSVIREMGCELYGSKTGWEAVAQSDLGYRDITVAISCLHA